MKTNYDMLLKIPVFSPKNIILCQSDLFNKVADPAWIYLFKVNNTNTRK